MAKIPRDVWDECRATAERKGRTLTYEELSVLLLDLAVEKENDQHLNAYHPGGGNAGNQGRGYQGIRPGQGTTPKYSRYMSNVQKLSWCDARNEQGCLGHGPDTYQHECFLVQGKKQETNIGGRAKMPDHYRCTITCAFCGKRKHYEDECYHKQRLSATLKSGKGNADKDKGKGKSKGHGKGQEKGKGGPGGPYPKPDNDKNQDRSWGNPNPTPGGTNPEPSGGQQNPGPTTRSQTQAQQEQGAKCGNEDGDESNPRTRSRFMRMTRKLRKKGFNVTCPAEF